jgi:hypothetical protein
VHRGLHRVLPLSAEGVDPDDVLKLLQPVAAGAARAAVTRDCIRSQAISRARAFIKKRVQGSDSFLFEDRNVRTCDNRRGSSRSELPPQTAKIVIDLRRPYRAKHESGSILENTPDLRVERFSASDLLIRLEKRTVRGVELSYRGRASCRIPLPEYLEQVPFHQRTK